MPDSIRSNGANDVNGECVRHSLAMNHGTADTPPLEPNMTTSLLEINKEIARLQAQADKLKSKEIGGVIKRIREAVEAYGLTAADLGLAPGGATRGRKPAAAVAAPVTRRGRKAASRPAGPGYRDGDKFWSGRGRRPAWIVEALAAGKSLDDFAAR